MNTEASISLSGSCECGACSFKVHTAPKGRFRCHCLICQSYNSGPFADVVAVRGTQVVLENSDNISFKRYRPPPNFDRGLCRTCGKPVVEVAGFGRSRILFIPVGNFDVGSQLPSVKMDIFYHRRVRDMHDAVPKYSGYFSSELAVAKMILGGL
jgi:hypothetical protein